MIISRTVEDVAWDAVDLARELAVLVEDRTERLAAFARIEAIEDALAD